jgi:hypothetical protein
MPSLDLYWAPIQERVFGLEELEDFLRAAHNSLKPGSFAGEMGRILVKERVEKKPVEIHLEDFTTVRTTTRIDGILPFRIPTPNNLADFADELLDEAFRIGLDPPESSERRAIEDDLCCAYLALLHGRAFRAIAGMRIPLKVACPYSPTSGRKTLLSVYGELPHGGIITAFTTRLPAEKFLHQLTPEAVGYTSKLSTDRPHLGSPLCLVEC